MKGTTVRKVAVVYNAKSGADIADGEPPVEEVLAELLAARGVVASFHAFDPKTVGPDVRKLLADGPDAVFTAGGDGTVTSVAAHLLGGDIPLGVLPAGTMNVLARDLGVPDDLEAALDSLLAASVRDIDVAEVNGRIFLCSALLALLPHLGRFRERARAKSVWMLPALFVRTWRALRRYPRMRLRVVVDGNAHTTRTRAVVVSNNPMSAGPAPMPGRDRLDSGRLAVYVARDRTPWDLAGIAAKVLDGSWQDSKRVRSHLGASVRIESGQLGMMSVMTDGEVTQLTTPLKFEIRSGALSVLAPMVRDEPG